MPQALGTFGVYRRLPDDAREVLALAEEYRSSLAALYQRRHEQTINLRNERFPELWDALVEFELQKARIAEGEAEIKAHHAKVRDRNTVKLDQRIDLAEARRMRAEALERVRAGRARWSAMLTAWRLWFKGAADWKNVKALAKRKTLYAAITSPSREQLLAVFAAEHAAKLAKLKPSAKEPEPLDASLVDIDALEAYGRLDMECDIAERELSVEYQSRGLASGIRGEIDKATAPKIGESGPGMRYVYGRPPYAKPWRKLTLQFVGGLSLESAIEGTSQFRLTDLGKRTWQVEQQIGTASRPRMISYRVRIHRPFPAGTRFQFWSLCVTGESIVWKNKLGIVREVVRDRATVIPTIADTLDKPTGDGVLHCRLSWRKVSGGVLVAEFLGPHVNEQLILPDWLVDARMDSKLTLSGCDTEANGFLASVGQLPKVRQRQGVVALRQYCFTHADDSQARGLLDSLVLESHLARRQSQRAIRAIEKVYETVVRRVCSLHGELALKKQDLRRKKKYDKRDLLAQDAMPQPVRELLHAVAPGKLQELLLGYGLAASGEVVEWDAGGSRRSDVFSSWVASLGRKSARESEENGTARESASGALA